MKKFTLENLKKDNACSDGMEFVKPIIEAGGDVAQSLAASHPSWLSWAIHAGYDCESARRPGFIWDEKGKITSTSGDGGTSASGDGGTSASGDGGTSTSGDFGTSISGDWGLSVSGHRGTSTSGRYGTSTSGDGGTSTSGDFGTSTSGLYGTSISGYDGISKSGDNGILMIRYQKNDRSRIAVGYIGKGGLKPNVPYKLDAGGKFVRADQEDGA